MHSTKTLINAYRPEAVWQARRAFFEQGSTGIDCIDAAVLRSWTRCAGQGRTANDPVEFSPVARQMVSALIEKNQALVDSARPELASLAEAVKDAGYAVLLTDINGQVLLVDGPIAPHSTPLRQAFRAGIDLSEPAIGTSAMSVAMSEQRAVRVLGAEHYLEDTQIFHCCAAPVFDGQGEVIGAVDVSHDMPGMQQSALWLAERCAQRIDQRLFLNLPAFLRLEIDVGEGDESGSRGATQAWLALGHDGELLAASREARNLMELPSRLTGVQFDFLFESRFHSWVSQLRKADSNGASLQLHSGVRLRARPFGGTPPRPTGVAASRPPEKATSHRLQCATSEPCFGDDRIQREFHKAVRVLEAHVPVLVTGETGCGKEVAAQALHAHGRNSAGPFVALNCAAIPHDLLAAELFGHVDGAFTGSRRGGAPGKIEAAHGGTLFLDEIGDMPFSLQASLLRVLDGKEVTRLGASTARVVDVQIVCATNCDLNEMVNSGRFRSDLFYRIAGHVFHLVPLRERRDFNALLDTLVLGLAADPDRLTRAVRQKLQAYGWPGNVRQLAHALRRAIALAVEHEPLSIDDFGLPVPMDEPSSPSAEANERTTTLLERVQGEAIDRAMKQTGGNVARAASLLGVGRATLYRKLGRIRRESATG